MNCPECDAALNIPEDAVGEIISCPDCGADLKSQRKMDQKVACQAESVGEDQRVMSKVCIVFDRLRTKRRCSKEASDLGHDALMLDAKITQVNTDSKKEDFDLGDVVLERCAVI